MKEPKKMRVAWLWLIIPLCIIWGSATNKPKEVVKTETKEVCTKEDTWKELKNKDDEVISMAAGQFTLTSQMIGSITDADFDAFYKELDTFKANTDKMTNLGNQRKEILTKLGY